VPDRVRDELRDEQSRILEPARREVVRHLAERAPRLRGRLRIARQVDLVPHRPPVTSCGSATKSSRSRIRVISNTRITCSLPGTSAPAAERLRALRRQRDHAQPARVHEPDAPQVEHDRAVVLGLDACELVLERGRAGQVQLSIEGDHRASAGERGLE